MQSFDNWFDDIAKAAGDKINKKDTVLESNNSYVDKLQVLIFIENQLLNDKDNFRHFIADIISSSFNWNDTKEGVEFWSRIYGLIRKGPEE